MLNTARPVWLSPAALALHPGLAAAVAAAGASVQAHPAGALAVQADSEPGMANGARVGQAARPRLDLAVPGAPQLAFAAQDTAFAAALIAALARGDDPVAADPAAQRLLAIAGRAAASDVGVLIGGPTGTGKEVLSRLIHRVSPRRDKPFVAVNCAALPEAMLEAVLFGHERGAFTGAAASAKGLFRAAHGGTLLLDEVAELPLALQAKLLRALQEREVLAIGATAPVAIDVRVIACANRDLGGEVAAGRFRADLFYRLAVFPLTTQALGARKADIVPLVASLLLRRATPLWPTPAALARLTAHDWPGNVRELDNVLQRATVYATSDRIEAADIVFDTPTAEVPAAAPTLSRLAREREFAAIRSMLSDTGGRRSETAHRLGISERTLRYKLAAMGGQPRGPTRNSASGAAAATMQ